MANRRFIDFPIAASVGDNDIVLIWQDGLNKQTTKATLLQGSPQSLAGLTDVDIAGLTNGQILQYNSTLGKWENVDRTDINLSELGDVTIVAPTNGQVLVYNSSTSKWENSSGGYVPYTGAVTTVNLGAQSILAGTFVKAGGTSAQFLKADGSVDSSTYGTGTVTSVALTMPTAFSVANSPVTTNGTLAVTVTGTTAQYIRGDGSLATFPSLTGFVPYTGATADVNLGTHDLAAERGTFENNGSSDTLTVNHTSGSGYGIIVTKGGNNEALYVSKTSGSGNAMTVVGGRTSLVDLALSSVSNTAGDFLTLSGGVVHKRTAAQTLTDIGGQAALTNPVTGTGTTNQIPKFTGTSSLGNSNLSDDGSAVTCSSELRVFGALNGTTASLTSTGTHLSFLRSTFNTFTISVGTASGISGLLFGNNTAGTFPLIISQTNGAATFSSSVTAGGVGTFGRDATTVLGYFGDPNTVGNKYISFSRSSAKTDIVNIQGIDAGVGGANIALQALGANVLIGTTTDSGFKLDVNGTGRFSSGLQVSGGPAGYGGGEIILNSASDAINAIYTNAGGSVGMFFDHRATSNTGYWVFRNGTGAASERMRLNATGNLGLGVTPSAWGSNFKAIQLSSVSSLSGYQGNFTLLGTNFYYDSAETPRYLTNASALLYRQGTDTHIWFNAPSGTAGNAITFTQAMTLTSGGNLLVGTTTDAGFKLDVNGTGRFSGTLTVAASVTDPVLISNSGASSYNSLILSNNNNFKVAIGIGGGSVGGNLQDNGYVGTISNRDFLLNTNNSERMRITSGGNVGIGTASPGAILHTIKSGTAISGVGDEVFIGQRSASTSNAAITIVSSGESIIRLTNSANIELGKILYDTVSNFMRFDTNSTERLRITSGGNVLIGTTTNGASKLRISGLPTSSSGLSSGDIWNDSGTLKIA